MELERKYKVNEIPKYINIVDIQYIDQGYLGIGNDASELRIRKINDREYYITCKTGTGIQRDEIEFPITQSLFNSLWSKTEGKRIKKKRLCTPWHQYVIEIDIFLDRDNLTIAEVEFPNEHASHDFIPPLWFGEEITDDIFYRNQKLAQ